MQRAGVPLARSMAIGCDLRRLPFAILGAVLDTLPPIPDTDLLSAQEAGERLREVVEGFFFWKRRTEDRKARRTAARQKSAWVGQDNAGAPMGVRYHLQQIGPAPPVKAPESHGNPGKFHTAVWGLV
jgi:hypothetical protein